MALVPAEAFTIEPTWFVAGMQGTGSDTVVVKDHFVPEYRVQRVKDMFASNFRSPFTEERTASMPFNAVAAGILVAPQIGLGRHALRVDTREASAEAGRVHGLPPSQGVAYPPDRCREGGHQAAPCRDVDGWHVL